jgi:hypothetical protein
MPRQKNSNTRERRLDKNKLGKFPQYSFQQPQQQQKEKEKQSKQQQRYIQQQQQ